MTEATCTSTDPTNHQGDTCPVHEQEATHGITCLCFNCVCSRYIEGVHCISCMSSVIVVESTEQCKACYYKYAQENRARQ